MYTTRPLMIAADYFRYALSKTVNVESSESLHLIEISECLLFTYCPFVIHVIRLCTCVFDDRLYRIDQ